MNTSEKSKKETNVKKPRLALRLQPSTMEDIERVYRKDDCRSKNEFIEKAIRYYIGHLDAHNSTSYLPNALISSFKSIIDDGNRQIVKMLFKLSVEQAIMMNVLAAAQDIDPEDLKILRGECVDEVRRTNGNFKMEDAVAWQQGGAE